jgi:hypothetical protein
VIALVYSSLACLLEVSLVVVVVVVRYFVWRLGLRAHTHTHTEGVSFSVWIKTLS